MATKKTQSVDVKYTAYEEERINNLKKENEKLDEIILKNTAEAQKYEKYISGLAVEIDNVSNANFKLFDKLANANAQNIDCKIALFDKEQQLKDSENEEGAVEIQLAKKKEMESATASQNIQNDINKNVREIEIDEKKINVAKAELRKLQFAIKKAEAQKSENEKDINEITANALKRQTENK